MQKGKNKTLEKANPRNCPAEKKPRKMRYCQEERLPADKNKKYFAFIIFYISRKNITKTIHDMLENHARRTCTIFNDANE